MEANRAKHRERYYKKKIAEVTATPQVSPALI
jgi:hypothetical protein